jgi:hypothetical protein
MRKYALILFIIMISLIAAGCVSCLESFVPTATVTPTVSTSTPTAIPTDTPTAIASTATPVPASGYKIYDSTNPGLYQPMQNGVKVEWSKTYRADDWKLQKIPSDIHDSHYGEILELNFNNPTSANKTVSYVYFKAGYTETLDYPNKFINSKSAFYDDENGFFYEFTMTPGESRTIWMYSILSDDDYNKYNGTIKMNGLTMNYDSGLIDP